MTEQQKHFPEFYVTAPQPCPYLPGRQERKLFTHLTHEKPSGLIDNLLRGGFRRSQNIAYMPYCEGCQACVSVRVVIDEFEPGRSMRRAIEANGPRRAARAARADIRAVRALPPLHRRPSLRRRHGRHDRARLRDDGRGQRHQHFRHRIPREAGEPARHQSRQLAAQSPSRCAISSPTASRWSTASMTRRARRSLGTYMILEHIEYARQLGCPISISAIGSTARAR